MFYGRIAMHKIAAALLAIALLFPSAVSAEDMSSTATLAKPAPGGVPWTANEIKQLRANIAKMLNAPTLRAAQVGFIIQDTVRGVTLYSQNADQDFMPASNFKLLVGSAALQRLGTSFVYTTSVTADAPPQGGVIHGNVYLHGGGDALLTAKDLDDAAAALAAAGIRRVDGAVVTDATRFDSQRYGYGWSWDDLPYYYAPVVTALELEDGVAHAFMSPGASVGAPVGLRVWPESGTFTIDNEMTTSAADKKDTSDLSRVWNKPATIDLTGTYPLGAKESGDLRPAVPDPESYAGDVFSRALNAHGITVANGLKSGKMPANATQLWSHNSEPMPQLLADFWYPSDNLMGELFLKELGVVQGGEPGSDANGRILEQAYLKSIGVDPFTVTISDGSGLSQYDRITPHDLLMILQADWNSPNRNVVLDALPVSGVRGTLKNAYLKTPAEHMVFAKTGSISHVRTVSGYVITKTHGPVTFSFMVNQWMDEDQPGGAGRLAQVRADVFSQIAVQ
jgi:serine-type D-Ala-D-Ala carboxypeptidase/endopeptidase (penicillin-binding protein 4)